MPALFEPRRNWFQLFHAPRSFTYGRAVVGSAVACAVLLLGTADAGADAELPGARASAVLDDPPAGTEISVTPDKGTTSAPAYREGNSVEFTVTVTEGEGGFFDVICDFHWGSVTSCQGDLGVGIFPEMGPTSVSVTYTTAASGSGGVTVNVVPAEVSVSSTR